MVKVVDGGQCAATQARFSPGARTGLHLVAAEAKDAPRPLATETAKTSKSFLKVLLLTSQSPRSSVCPMSDARASTPRLSRSTRIAHCPGPIRQQPPYVRLGPGVGVLLSAGSVLIVQGGLTLAGAFFGAFMDKPMILAMTSTGGVLLVRLGLGLLELKEVRVANMLPALVVAPLFVALAPLWPF
jgi:hypothetical protein